MTTNVEISCPTSDEASFENEAKRKSIQISERPSDLLSKEGFALYIGKTPRAVAEMAKAGKLPAFYMTDPLNQEGKLNYGLIAVSGTSTQPNWLMKLRQNGMTGKIALVTANQDMAVRQGGKDERASLYCSVIA